MSEEHLIGLAVALGLGLLTGTERERSKGQGPDRRVAGVRGAAHRKSRVGLLGLIPSGKWPCASSAPALQPRSPPLFLAETFASEARCPVPLAARYGP